MTSIAARLRQQAESLLAMADEIDASQSQASDFANILDNVAGFVSVKQAAAIAGLSERQAYRVAQKIGHRVGREWLIDPDMLAKGRRPDGEGRRSNRDDTE